MKLPKFTRESALYLLAFLLACAVRLSNLGNTNLTNPEANLALQALAAVRGNDAGVLGPHPLYLALTTSTIFFFGASDFAARLWPALAGSLMVLAPYLFRKRMGHMPSVLLAFFVAIDPGLVAISRQAGGPALAMATVLLALGAWQAGFAGLSGILVGLSLLSGPWVWQGWLGLALAGWAYTRFLVSEPGIESENGIDLNQLKRAGWFALATFVLGGTFFFFMPGGMSAAATSLVVFVQSWYLPSGTPTMILVQALLSYNLLPLIAGLVGIGLGWKKKTVRFLTAWLIFSFVLAILPLGRQTASLGWTLIPLWALAAGTMTRLFNSTGSQRIPILGQAVLGAVILVYISLSLVSISGDIAAGRQQAAQWLVLAAAVVLLLLSTLLVAWGWSGRVARLGLVWSLVAVMFVYTLMNSWNAAGLSGRRPAELWAAGPAARDGDLIRATIEDLSLWNTGVRNKLEVVVVGNTTPALRWLLRDQQQVQYTQSLSATSAPSLVLTADQNQPALAAAYRGQDFVLEEIPLWNSNGLQGWFRWQIFREIPMNQQSIVLWARTDLFVGDDVEVETSPEPAPVDDLDNRQ